MDTTSRASADRREAGRERGQQGDVRDVNQSVLRFFTKNVFDCTRTPTCAACRAATRTRAPHRHREPNQRAAGAALLPAATRDSTY